MAQWSERSPCTSEIPGSLMLLVKFLNVSRAQCSTHAKRVTQHSAESRGFSSSAPVSPHKEVDRVGWEKHTWSSKISIIVKISCLH